MKTGNFARSSRNSAIWRGTKDFLFSCYSAILTQQRPPSFLVKNSFSLIKFPALFKRGLIIVGDIGLFQTFCCCRATLAGLYMTVARLQHDLVSNVEFNSVEWNGCRRKQNTLIKKRFSKLLNIFYCIYNRCEAW